MLFSCVVVDAKKKIKVQLAQETIVNSENIDNDLQSNELQSDRQQVITSQKKPKKQKTIKEKKPKSVKKLKKNKIKKIKSESKSNLKKSRKNKKKSGVTQNSAAIQPESEGSVQTAVPSTAQKIDDRLTRRQKGWAVGFVVFNTTPWQIAYMAKYTLRELKCSDDCEFPIVSCSDNYYDKARDIISHPLFYNFFPIFSVLPNLRFFYYSRRGNAVFVWDRVVWIKVGAHCCKRLDLLFGFSFTGCLGLDFLINMKKCIVVLSFTWRPSIKLFSYLIQYGFDMGNNKFGGIANNFNGVDKMPELIGLFVDHAVFDFSISVMWRVVNRNWN